MSFCFQIISKAILDTWKHFLDLFQEKGLSESLCLTLNWNTRKPDLRQQNERSLRCLNSCDFHFCGNEICLFQGKFLNLKVSQAHLYFLTRYSIVTLVILLCITNLYKFCLHVLKIFLFLHNFRQGVISLKESELDPHTLVMQKVADEVVFRCFQGEGVEFFLIGPHWPPDIFDAPL